VGSFDVEAQAVPGVVEASRSLAETYSRLIQTDAIVARTAEILGVDPDQVQGSIGASSIPNASIIRVEATAAGAPAAAARANAAAEALVEYAAGGADDQDLQAQYDEALLEHARARAEVERLNAELQVRLGIPDPAG